MISSNLFGNTEWERAKINAFELVQNQFGSLPFNCQSLDRDLKRLQDAIANAYKMPLSFDQQGNANLYQRAYKEQLELKKKIWESTFSSKGCRDIIENIRLTSVAIKETENAIKSEKEVLTTSDKDQNIYIGIGAVVLLVGLYIVLNK
jgi:hypothetical protein